MGTKCKIGVKLPNDRIRFVRCTHDGYFLGVGKKLFERFNSLEKANSLIQLGDLSGIDSPYYEGDEAFATIRECDADKYVNKEDVFTEYYYLFADGSWIYSYGEDFIAIDIKYVLEYELSHMEYCLKNAIEAMANPKTCDFVLSRQIENKSRLEAAILKKKAEIELLTLKTE